jgi:hypothetical protein
MTIAGMVDAALTAMPQPPQTAENRAALRTSPCDRGSTERSSSSACHQPTPMKTAPSITPKAAAVRSPW